MDSSVITILAVIAIAIICFVFSQKIKVMLKDISKSEDKLVGKTAKLVSESANAFEESLKQAFNEAIADGVITKDEALSIVTKTMEATRAQFITSLTNRINDTE